MRRDPVMQLWRLSPVDPANRAWRMSLYTGPVIVRAPNLTVARGEAARCFSPSKAEASPRAEASPWWRADLVTAVLVQGTLLSCRGPTRVLHPALPIHAVAASAAMVI